MKFSVRFVALVVPLVVVISLAFAGGANAQPNPPRTQGIVVAGTTERPAWVDKEMQECEAGGGTWSEGPGVQGGRMGRCTKQECTTRHVDVLWWRIPYEDCVLKTRRFYWK